MTHFSPHHQTHRLTPFDGRPPARWFWQRSLRNRILVTYGALFLAALLLIGIYVGREVYDLQLEQAEHDLEVSAFLIANALEDPFSGYPQALEQYGAIDIDETMNDERIRTDNDLDEGSPKTPAPTPITVDLVRANPKPVIDRAVDVAFQEFVTVNMRNETARVMLLSVHGDVIADSLATEIPVPSQFVYPEVQAALTGLEQHDIRTDPQRGIQTLYAAAPVQQGRRLLGVVRLARPMSEVLLPTRLFFLNLFLGSLVALLGTALLGTALSRYLVRPLQKLEEAAEQVAQGDLTLRAPVESADEVGALAVSFNAMVAQLRALLEKQHNFVANASHELRTPLTNIKLRSEAVLGMAVDLPPRARRYIAEIDSEADRLRRLANTLLELASIAEGISPPPTAATDLAPALLELARSFRLVARQADLTLRVRIPEQLCPLWVWPDHVLVIMSNLLDNAIKYTPAGGEVQLTITMTSVGVTLQVRDNGPGIPASDLPYIFDRFYRVDKARSRQSAGSGTGSGAGLGLAIVQRLVELNGGRLTVVSELGTGATFTVTFPCAA